MSFKRFVETGRIAYIAHGPHKGKLCSIVDIIDQTRVLVDGPLTGVQRQGIRINDINLTKFRLSFPRHGGSGIVKRAWKEEQITPRWEKSIWAKNLADKKKRLAMTDFDRFKLRKAISSRNKIRSRKFFDLRKMAYRKNELYGMRKAKKTDQMRESAKKKSMARNKKRAALRARLAKVGVKLTPRSVTFAPPRGTPKAEKASKDGKPKKKPAKKASKLGKLKQKRVADKASKTVAPKEKPTAKQAPKK